MTHDPDAEHDAELTAVMHERRHLIGASYYLKGVRLPPLPYLVPIGLMWGLTIGLIIIQKDLGAALLFFTIFLAMLYLGTGRATYVVAGVAILIPAAYVVYRLYAHVQLRVEMWQKYPLESLGSARLIGDQGIRFLSS